MKLMQSNTRLCQAMGLILLISFLYTTQAFPQVAYVVHVKNPTYYQEFQCVTEPEAENTKYSWHRQDWAELPQGVKVEGDRLHFQKTTPDLNGLYICEVVNQYGAAAGSLYRHDNYIHSEL